MDVSGALGQLNLGSKPWLGRSASPERLSELLTGPPAREHWKYTPITRFVDAFVANCATIAPATLQLEDSDQGGVSVQSFNELAGDDLAAVRNALEGLDPARYPFAELAILNDAPGYLIKVHGELADPISLNFTSPQQLVLLDVSDNAQVTLIELSGPSAYATSTLLRLGRGCRVTHARCALDAALEHLSLLDVIQAADSSYDLQQYLVGGDKRRAEVHLVLAEPGAHASVTGAYLTEQGRHLDQQLVVEHRAPNTRSRQTIHGIGLGTSKSVFNGRIHIHAGASGTDATLSNKNLALGSATEIDTKPELEIYTDDVKCAHGATVGQLDNEQIFYLQSRGMPEAQARALLCSAFVRTCVTGPLAEQVTDRLTRGLR